MSMRFVSVIAMVAALCGCAEAVDGSTGSGEGASGSGSGSGGSTGSGSGTPKVVINEISGTGEEWVEIVNIGDGVLALEKYAVTDVLADGTPNLAEACRFQPGTNLSPGEYLLIVGKVKTPSPGPQTSCLMAGGPTSCYQAAWGISDSMGDKVFFLSTTDEILEEVAYPIHAAPVGNTYGRLPNGAGDFAATKPTPGETNVGP